MAQHLLAILREVWTLWLEMGVYLLFGFAVAGILSRILKTEFIARRLGSNSIGSIAKASLFGVPLPLCSCGVVPVALSLRKRGASRSATVSFLISTPETGVDSILVTYALLGPVFAVVRPIAAFLNGVLGGIMAAFAEPNGKNARNHGAAHANHSHERHETDSAQDSHEDCGSGSDSGCCATAISNGTASHPGRRVSLPRHAALAFRYGFLDFPREIAGWLVAGIILAGIIAHFLPKDFLSLHLGGEFKAMAVMALVGIPLYICSTASVPVVSMLVLHGGLSAGAALVFLITGPATNVASLVMITKALGRKTAALYLTSIVITAFACGYLLNLFYSFAGTSLAAQAVHIHDSMAPGWLMGAGAAGLALVTLGALIHNGVDKLRRRKERAEMSNQPEIAHELKVPGMTCENCAGHVAEAAKSVAGVTGAWVDLPKGIVRVAGVDSGRAALIQAIETAGYRAE